MVARKILCALLATTSTVLAQLPVYVETDTGVSLVVGQGTGTNKGGVPMPFQDVTSCAVSVTDPSGTKYYPNLTLSGGNKGACNAGTFMNWTDPNLGGSVSIYYTAGACGDYGGVCNPDLVINGRVYFMVNAPNCETGSTCPTAESCYQYYRCAFLPYPKGVPDDSTVITTTVVEPTVFTAPGPCTTGDGKNCGVSYSTIITTVTTISGPSYTGPPGPLTLQTGSSIDTPTLTSTPSPTAPTTCSSEAPIPGPTGPGEWGLEYLAGGCSGTAEYGAYGNTPYDCSNLVADKDWDSIFLTRTGGMQVQLFAEPDCNPCGGCDVYNDYHFGDSQACVTQIGFSKGPYFAKSFKVVQNGSAPGVCLIEGNAN